MNKCRANLLIFLSQESCGFQFHPPTTPSPSSAPPSTSTYIPRTASKFDADSTSVLSTSMLRFPTPHSPPFSYYLSYTAHSYT